MKADELLDHISKNRGLKFTAAWLCEGYKEKGKFVCQVELDSEGVKVLPCTARDRAMRMTREIFKEAYDGEWEIIDVLRG